MREVGEKTPVGEIVSERLAFDHPFFPVVERVIRTPEGVERASQLLWGRFGKQFSVAIAPDKDNRFVFVEEPKYGQMRRMVSAPTGGVKKGEQPMDAAMREFREETGYQLESCSLLCPSGIVDSADKTDGGEHWIFVGHDAVKVGEPRDPGQKVILATPHEALAIMAQGRMPAMSMAAVLMFLHTHRM